MSTETTDRASEFLTVGPGLADDYLPQACRDEIDAQAAGPCHTKRACIAGGGLDYRLCRSPAASRAAAWLS